MHLLNAVLQLDWIRAVRFWIIIGIAVAALESATLFGRALAAKYGRKS
jgi:hypothetical protein